MWLPQSRKLICDLCLILLYVKMYIDYACNFCQRFSSASGSGTCAC